MIEPEGVDASTLRIRATVGDRNRITSDQSNYRLLRRVDGSM
jgi:hypothetical protein